MQTLALHYRRGASNAAHANMKKLDGKDLALRATIIAAGSVAALLLVLKGQAQAVPALAVGATLGAVMMGQFGPSEE